MTTLSTSVVAAAPAFSRPGQNSTTNRGANGLSCDGGAGDAIDAVAAQPAAVVDDEQDEVAVPGHALRVGLDDSGPPSSDAFALGFVAQRLRGGTQVGAGVLGGTERRRRSSKAAAWSFPTTHTASGGVRPALCIVPPPFFWPAYGVLAHIVYRLAHPIPQPVGSKEPDKAA